MPQPDNRPSLNPTVEEANDSDSQNTYPTNSDASHNISWSEVCARHESVLASHIHMLNTVRNNVAAKGGLSEVVSGMIEKTNRLVTQFRVIEKYLVVLKGLLPLRWDNRGTEQENFHRGAENSVTAESTEQSVTSASSRRDSSKRRPSRSTERRKRSRIEDSMDVESESMDTVPLGAVQYHKRQRLDMLVPGSDEDVGNVTPVAMETEDISDEVRRRLEIKEEQRRKRNTKPEKRKRDSIASTSSTSSPGDMSNPKKRAKIGTSRDSTVDVPWGASRGKKNLKNFGFEQGSAGNFLEEKRRAKRQKHGSATPRAS
ncbi:uncharacterized protein BDW43DRAFT_306099 [Aspergillus alliaceus]|uniref:uncharacterized protein n=1 Tax=Petromyces alliaceus TaxID=209559 RepID=UPI0012A6FA00|nr:uncharacterized protein BDW43DRAFT_306099 [Aspergillus alliaceus]KAB8239217.1 hypothetical protein BDW43DRAFT_306099 [Aspergillus alliaceus]